MINDKPLFVERGGIWEAHYYLQNNNSNISVWQHEPKDTQVQKKIVLLCPPLGYEMTHTYRTYRRLAESLCRSGYIVFRFDFSGAGDSTGNEVNENALEQWIGDIHCLSRSMASIYPDNTQCWIGLRLGATLAALASQQANVESLVLWEPIYKGRPYIRELEAIVKLAAFEGENNNDYFECAGFILSKVAAEEIKKINFTKSNPIPADCDVVTISRPTSKKGGDAFIGQLRDSKQLAASFEMDDFEEMMAVPHESKVPEKSIDFIVDALRGDVVERLEPIVPSNAEASILLYEGDVNIQEKGCFVGENHKLFGVLTEGVSSSLETKPVCVLLLNSGSVHHMGPNAVYSQMSRSLSNEKLSVFRMDLENIGDSLLVDKEQENHPYQSNAIDNVKDTIATLRSQYGYDRFVVAGICSGAYNAFRTGIETKGIGVEEVLVINPLTFKWKAGMSLAIPGDLALVRQQSSYKKSYRDVSKWKGLFLSKDKLLNAMSFVIMRSLKLGKDLLIDLLSIAGVTKKPLVVDLEKTWSNDIFSRFVFASKDPGLDIVNAEARWAMKKGIKEGKACIDLVQNADHTFSTKASRQDLFQILKRRLEQRS